MPEWNPMLSYITMIIIPSILMIIFNSLIFIYVRSSSRRVHTIGTNRNYTINRNTRDIYVVKHMLFITIIFVVGWTPTLILALPSLAQISSYQWVNSTIRTLPVISSTIIGLDFAFFNHEIRRYIKRKSLALLHLN